MLSEMYSKYQDQNPEKFNDDFITGARNRDDILEYLRDISKALEVVEGIKFMGVEVMIDESAVAKEFIRGRFRFKIEESRFKLIKMRFRLTKGDETEDVELKLLFPALVDRFYYMIDGCRYFSIWQMVDRATYMTAKTFSLKTLLMPIVFRTDKYQEVVADSGEEINGRLLILDIFKNRRNVLVYYFAKMGVTAAIEYFRMDDKVALVLDEDGIEFNPSEYLVFKAGKGVRVVCSKLIIGDQITSSFVVSLLDALSLAKGITRESADSPEQWLRRLGKFYTKNTNSQLDKAKRVMISLERVLDDCTRKNLAEVPAADKMNVYAIMRYMIMNYEELSKVDNMDLCNKRIRMSEYLIHPLLMRFSENTYRLLNNKQVTLAGLKSIFRNIKPGFIIKRLLNNKLLRYSNLVNDLDLFSCALKWSARGPQSLADGARSDISVKYRGVHNSYVGRIGLAAASSSDPGLTGTFVPFVKIVNGFFEQE